MQDTKLSVPAFDTRYLVGGPGWSGAGPAAVGMMSCPCPQMIRGVLSPAAAGRW